MSYQWGSHGHSFEYPTCYRIENRFLTLRGSALLLFALAMFWVALAGPDTGESAALRSDLPEPGSPTPYLVAASLFMLLGVVNIALAASRQRLVLTPGQPASLAHELHREATGVATGAQVLLQALSRGAVVPPKQGGSYRRFLLALSGEVASAPRSLQAYLQLRVAHFLLGVGLLVLLALNGLVSAQATAHSLASLLVAILSGAVVARSVLGGSKDAPGPVFLGVVLALGGVCSLVMGIHSQSVPQVARMTQLELPLAAAILLGSLLLIEGLGLIAGRAHLGTLPASRITVDELSLDAQAEPSRVLQEIDLELHRRWVERIPNRRYIWQPPVIDPLSAVGEFTSTVLEESQPLLSADTRATEAAAAQARVRVFWLLALGVLGLICTLGGGVLWVQLAHAHVRDVAAPWTNAAIGAVLIVAGGHALRVAHLLWSRFEVESALTWLEIKGTHGGLSNDLGVSAPGLLHGQDMVVRARVVRATSVFYAAAEHRLGSRSLLSMVDDPVSARIWTQQVRDFALKLEEAPPNPYAGRTADPSAKPRPAQGAGTLATPTPRFCSTCGTPVLAEARFCQQCGHTLTQG